MTVIDMLLQVMGLLLTHVEIEKMAVSISGSTFDILFNASRVVLADAHQRRFHLEPIFLKKKQERWVMVVIADSEKLEPMSFDAWTNQPLTVKARDWMKAHGITEVDAIPLVTKFVERRCYH